MRLKGGAEMDDGTLVVAAQNGCRDAFGQLLDHHERAIYAFVLKTEGYDRELAADVVQDTFEVACRRLHRFRGQSQFRTWLLGIAVNRIRAIRRRQRLRAMLRLDDVAEMQPSAMAPTPSESLHRDNQRAMIESVFAKLSAVQREALYMREFEDLSHEEIALALGLNRNTVKSRIHSARQAMLRELDGMKAVLVGEDAEEVWHETA